MCKLPALDKTKYLSGNNKYSIDAVKSNKLCVVHGIMLAISFILCHLMSFICP